MFQTGFLWPVIVLPMWPMEEDNIGLRRASFAQNLQPLIVAEQGVTADSGIFRTCALIAATPHTAVNRKLVTDRCKSHLIPRPNSSLVAAVAAAAAAQQPRVIEQQPGCSYRGSTAPQLRRAASPLFAREYAAPAAAAAAARRGSTAQSQQTACSWGQAGPGTSHLAAVPPVLQFEGWWLRLGQGGSRHKCSVHITYHTDTVPAAFYVRGELDSSSSREPYCRCAACGPQSNHSRCCTADTVSCSQQTPSLPPEGAWLCVTGASGEPLDQWDLHVGAELSLLGRKVVIKKASCAAMAWLDAWAKLLLEAQYYLEQQLSKFTAVIAVQGLVRHSSQRSDYGSPKVPVTPTGGKVNLRHLRESVGLLAARLRQHKADVYLPKELQDLTPQGPSNWVEELPQVMFMEPFTPAPAKHSCGTQLLQREFSRHNLHGRTAHLPTLGMTPAGDRAETNHNSLMAWLDSIPLAASAAKTPKTRKRSKHPAGLLELP